MATRVNFKSRSGGDARGEIIEPAGTGKAPGLVLVQEWWGLNDHIRSLVERFASAGFVTLAPDLFHGKTTKNAQEAAQWMQALDKPNAIEEIAGAQTFLAAHPRCNGNVGVTGFCMGGALTLASAAMVAEMKAAVAFYGLPDAGIDFSKTRAAIQMHVASKDHWVTVDLARALQEKLQKQGHAMELHIYEADHAFVNDTRPEVHNPGAATLALDRAVAFLHQHLG